jgi:hypothetical protein
MRTFELTFFADYDQTAAANRPISAPPPAPRLFVVAGGKLAQVALAQVALVHGFVFFRFGSRRPACGAARARRAGVA